MNILIQLDKGAYMPLKAHKADAGIIDTGVHVAIPQGFVGLD